MSEISAGECSHICEQHSRALKRRTAAGGTLVAGVGLQVVPWSSITTAAEYIDPSLHGITIVVGVIFAADMAIAGFRRVRNWAKDRVVVVRLGSSDRPPDQK